MPRRRGARANAEIRRLSFPIGRPAATTHHAGPEGVDTQVNAERSGLTSVLVVAFISSSSSSIPSILRVERRWKVKVAKTADRSTSCCTTKKKKKALEGRVERERETQVLSLYAKELSVAVRIVVKVEGSARVLCCLCASAFFCK